MLRSATSKIWYFLPHLTGMRLVALQLQRKKKYQTRENFFWGGVLMGLQVSDSTEMELTTFGNTNSKTSKKFGLASWLAGSLPF